MKDDNNVDDQSSLDETMYFGEERDYENNDNLPYTEEEMYDGDHPMTNTNSVEYDDGDYESNYYESNPDTSRKNMIRAYIFALVVIAFIILAALFSLK